MKSRASSAINKIRITTHTREKQETRTPDQNPRSGTADEPTKNPEI